MKQIYLDSAAGQDNPSSLHQEGILAARKLDQARRKVAEILHAQPDEIIFTSGGTESNNLAIFGLKPRHLITTDLEHASVLEPAKKFNASFISNISELKNNLKKQTDLVSVIYAHNEIGVINNIREVAKVIRKFRLANKSRTPYLHTDACQAAKYLDLNVQKLGVDLLTLNGAKIGVAGVGCLFVRRGIKILPVLLGGGQERGLRSGTENVAGIIKFARALELAQKNREMNNQKVSKLRDYFIVKLLKLKNVKLNGPEITENKKEVRLANNVSVSFAGLLGEQIVLELDAKGIACSTGAACSLQTHDLIKTDSSAVRFSLSPETKKSDLDYVLRVLPDILKKLNSVKKLNKQLDPSVT
ncbi:MAG: cysteine desulfurase family protein [Patescibacteria group bacterium]